MLRVKGSVAVESHCTMSLEAQIVTHARRGPAQCTHVPIASLALDNTMRPRLNGRVAERFLVGGPDDADSTTESSESSRCTTGCQPGNRVAVISHCLGCVTHIYAAVADRVGMSGAQD